VTAYRQLGLENLNVAFSDAGGNFDDLQGEEDAKQSFVDVDESAELSLIELETATTERLDLRV